MATTDAFEGAEQSVDKQKQDALNALAQFGRRGLEAAVLAQQESGRISSQAQQRNVAFANERGVGARGQAELDALQAPAREAYATNAQRAVDFLASEQGAGQQVTGNYFNQVRQAVPLERTSANTIADQYRAAAAEREAARQAQALRDQEAMRQVALQQQLVRDQMARDAAFQRLLMEGYTAEEAAVIADRLQQVTPPIAVAPARPVIPSRGDYLSGVR